MTARSVFGIDPLTSAISFAQIVEGDPIPKLGYTPAPKVRTKPDLATAAGRIADQADDMTARVRAARPVLVMMPRLYIGPLSQDPSGPRRAGLYWAVVRSLTEAGFPVADFPTLTLEKYMGIAAKHGYKAAAKLGTTAQTRWTGMKRNMNDNFRYSTVPLAAVGCAAVGIPTAVAVTDERLKLLRSGTWPEGFKLPGDIEKWKALHGNAVQFGGCPDDEDNQEEQEATA